MYISPGKFCVGGGADTVIPLTFCTCDVSRGQGGLDCHLTLRPMLERHEADRCCPFLLQKKKQHSLYFYFQKISGGYDNQQSSLFYFQKSSIPQNQRSSLFLLPKDNILSLFTSKKTMVGMVKLLVKKK